MQLKETMPNTKLYKVGTFNCNSIRSRLGIVLDWLKKEEPDVLALQETKVVDELFPKSDFEKAGWNAACHGQKAYNGVAFISKKPMKNVEFRLYPKDPEEPARFIAGDYEGVRHFNTYIPQGYDIESDKYQYKLKFFADLRKYFVKNVKPAQPTLWMGDLNIAPEEIDLYDPKGNKDHVCFHVDARNAFKKCEEGLWTDLFREKVKEGGHYTFWDYRQPMTLERNIGWRVDHILGTSPMVKRLANVWIDRKPRAMEKPSDHTFLIAEFSQ
jgi:exodeoxyribonuclease-3